MTLVLAGIIGSLLSALVVYQGCHWILRIRSRRESGDYLPMTTERRAMMHSTTHRERQSGERHQ
jgi:hypothetical protein